jgi:alpha-amylase
MKTLALIVTATLLSPNLVGCTDDGTTGSSEDGSGNDGGKGDSPLPVSARAAIVQLFDWSFNDIKNELPTLAKIGYSHVHVSPPMLSNASTQWWGRYQPVDYRVIDGPLGNEAEFRAMVTAANKIGVKIIVDIVFNHMANFGGDFNLTYPPPANERQSMYGKSYPELDALGPLFQAGDFHDRFCIQNYNNPQEVRDGRICGGGGDSGLPDLRQSNDASSKVLTEQRAFLQRLIDMGVGGFRFDAIKHMDASYFQALLSGLPSSLFNFGESIAEPNRASFESSLEPFFRLNLPMKYYDFPLVNTMRDAFGFGGKLSSLAGPIAQDLKAISGPLAVTFVLNHDIPQNPMDHYYMGKCRDQNRYGDPVNERLAYAFVLGRVDGMPYVYSDRGTSGNDGVLTDAYKNAHKRCDVVKMMRFHALTLRTSESVTFAGDSELGFRRGDKAVVLINKAGQWWATPDAASSGLVDGEYVDVVSGFKTTATNGHFTGVSIGPRSAAMYVHTSIYTSDMAADLAATPCETPAPVVCQ